MKKKIQIRQAQYQKIALQLFHDQGFRGTTMRKIAELAGCDVANLYNYFSSKNTILKNALFFIDEKFQNGINEITAAPVTSKEKLKRIIELYTRLSKEYPLHTSLLTREWIHLHGKDRETFTISKKAYEKKVVSIIQEGMEKKAFKNYDVNLAAHLLFSVLRQLFDSKSVIGTKAKDVDIEKSISDFIFSGLAHNG